MHNVKQEVQKQWVLLVLCIVLGVFCIVGFCYYNRCPQIQISHGLSQLTVGSSVQSWSMDTIFRQPVEEQIQDIHVQMDNVQIQQDSVQNKHGNGSVSVDIGNDGDKHSEHQIEWYEHFVKSSKQVIYDRYMRDNSSGWTRVQQDTEMFAANGPEALLALLQNHSLSWKLISEKQSMDVMYSAMLDKGQTSQLLQGCFPSVFYDSTNKDLCATVKVGLTSGIVTYLTIEIPKNDMSVQDVGLSSFSCTMIVQMTDMPLQGVEIPRMVQDTARTGINSTMSLLDILLVREGFTLPDTESWQMETITIPDGLTVLKFGDYKIAFSNSLFSNWSDKDGVLFGATSDNRYNARITGVKHLSGVDMINQNRHVANEYYKQEQAAGHVKDINIQEVNGTNLGVYPVYWYLEEYTDCSQRSKGNTVVRTYYFYVMLPDNQGVCLELQEMSDVASQSSLTDVTALRMLSDLLIQDMR